MAISEFRADLIPKIRELDISVRRKILNSALTGNLVTRFKGAGYEFEGFRNYIPTDDANKIDWKAYLRSGKLVVREFDTERSFFVFILVDTGNSMLFASTDKLKAEYTAELAASLCFAMLEVGAGVGFGLYNDKLVVKQKPMVSKRQYYYLIKELTNVDNYGGKSNLPDAIKFLLSFLKEKSFVIIISDFIGLDQAYFRYLEILSHVFQVVGIMVRDPRDRTLPKGTGQYVLEDPFSKETLYIDVNQYAKAYEEYVREEEKLIQRKFELAKAELLSLSTDRPFADEVIKFFRINSERWK